MATSPANGLETEDDSLPPGSAVDELERALQLANQLCSHLSMRMDGASHEVRMRLARAHALSLVDLLMAISRDRAHSR